MTKYTSFKLSMWVSYSTVAMITIFIFWTFYVIFLMCYPFKKAVRFEHGKIQVLIKQVCQGDPLPLRLVFEKFVDGPSLVTTKFIDGGVFSLPDYTVYRPSGKYDFVSYDLSIPPHLPPGKYHIQRDYTTDVNWLRKDHVVMVSEDFEVLEKSPHNDTTDEALFNRLINKYGIKNNPGAVGPAGPPGKDSIVPGPKGDRGERGPRLFGK